MREQQKQSPLQKCVSVQVTHIFIEFRNDFGATTYTCIYGRSSLSQLMVKKRKGTSNSFTEK